MSPVFHDPGGLGFKIESLYAFLAVHGDGDEGLVGVPLGGMTMPAIAADRTRLDQLRPIIERQLLPRTRKPIVLVQFTTRIDLGTL